MTGAVVGLVTSYVALATLLLSLNLRSAWPWPVKAAAIGVTAGFFGVTFITLQAMLGWPTEALPPQRFALHATLIEEPDRKGGPGAIYLWLSPRDAEGEVAGPPRAYALPYSRVLHEAAVRAQAKLQEGRPIDGTSGHSPYGVAAPSDPVQLFERMPPPLPAKTG